MKKVFLALLPLTACLVQAGDFSVNGLTPDDVVIVRGDGGTWTVDYARDFARGGDFPELKFQPGGVKKHPQHAHIAGYNGDVTIKIAAPGPVASLSVKAAITNFADSETRAASLLYSLNGLDFTPLDEKEFGGGSATLAGRADWTDNKGLVWLRLHRALRPDDGNGRYGYVLWTSFSFQLNGMAAPVAPAAAAEMAAPQRLAALFPTGAFWPWERTLRNAEMAGMELWDFVEHAMNILKVHHVDTIWFVNIGPSDDARRLLLASERHGLKALINTDLLSVFYHGFPGMEQAEQLARRTVNAIGDCPALLGYILKDEPLLCSLSQTDFLYRLMKAADPSRDSITITMNRQSPSFLAESELPVICSDIYYFGHLLSTHIPNPAAVSQKKFTQSVDGLNRIAEAHGKRSWLMPMMFGDVWGRHHSAGDKVIVEPGSYLHWRMPTIAETRWQIWESVRLGSTGVLFYVLLPPQPLTIPPDQVRPGTPEAKLLDRMDKNAASAKAWGTQPLTQTRIEIEPGAGMLQPGGQPTPQMGAMGGEFAILRNNANLLAGKRRAAFPTFFAADVDTGVMTFERPEAPELRWGVVVNHDLDKSRRIEILLPPNVTGLVNRNDGATLTVEKADENFRRARLELAAGAGALLEAAFAGGRAGIPLCRERFNQGSMTKVKLNEKNSEVFRFGEYGIQPFYGVRQTGRPAEPVFTLENLTHPEKAGNTFAMNLNATRRQGVIYAQANGSLASLTVKADAAAGSGEATNVAHLANANEVGAGADNATNTRTIREGGSPVPMVVPVGTTRLEFYLKDHSDRIDELTIWFAPDP